MKGQVQIWIRKWGVVGTVVVQVCTYLHRRAEYECDNHKSA